MLIVYTLEQSEQWNTVVRSFTDYDVYWLSGYVKAFQIHGDGEPLLFDYEGNGIRGINVVMKRDIAHDKYFAGKIQEGQYFDFSTPYGYGGWIVEGENNKELFKAYEEWCQKNNIISEFIRFHPVLENHRAVASNYEVVPLGNTVTLSLPSPEVIWANLTSKNRNVIRKAQNHGIKIFYGRYPEIFEIFQEIYNLTMDRDNAESYYYFNSDFYKSVLNNLPHNAQVFYAELSGNVISASIILMANGKMSYHLSGFLKEYSNLAPTNLLLYEVALWGCANGYKTLYLGGGVGSREDSLFKFKKAFYRGDDFRKFHIGKKIFNQEIYNKLANMRDRVSEGGYFPKYRALA